MQQPNYNRVITVKELTSDATEPVTLTEQKQYMRLEGFQDVSDSMSTPFTDDDTYIETLITAARKKLEKLYGISIVGKTLKATLTNLCGNIEIPQGPVTTITSVFDRYGNEIVSPNYKVVGDDFPVLECPQFEKLQITYDAGYTECPEALKAEIMAMVNYRYVAARGDKDFKDFNYSTGEYSRIGWLI